ncbi:MAG TPA: hypothetical protein VGJ93_01840 [Desulfuromonadaceae bacterium]|jgi:hypothetical protein
MDKRIDLSGMEALLDSLQGLEKAFMELQQAMLAKQRRLEPTTHVEQQPTKLPLKENPTAMVDMVHRMAINPSLVHGDKQKQAK